MPLSSWSVSIQQHERGAAAAEERRERLLEVLVDHLERFLEALTGGPINPSNRLGRLRDGVDQVLPLRRQERVPPFELVELIDRHHVHRSETVDLLLQLNDGAFRRERFR